MQDIKNYSLETDQSDEELIQSLNETVTDSSDEDEDEEPPKEMVTLEAKPATDKVESSKEHTTVPAKPGIEETVPLNEPAALSTKPGIEESLPPNEPATLSTKQNRRVCAIECAIKYIKKYFPTVNTAKGKPWRLQT